MNNFDLHEEAQQLADTKTAYELARELVGHKNEIRRLKQSWADELEAVKAHRNKIKAEAVREFVRHIRKQYPHWSPMTELEMDALDYADKLERGEA